MYTQRRQSKNKMSYDDHAQFREDSGMASRRELSQKTQDILAAMTNGQMPDGSSLDDLSIEELQRAREEAALKLNPLAYAKKDTSGKHCNIFIGNFQRQFERTLAMTSVVAYMFRMAEEHFVKDAAMYEDAGRAKADTLRFLNHFFEFNPDSHVSEMRKPHPNPTIQKKFEEHVAKVRAMAKDVEIHEQAHAVTDVAAEKARSLVSELLEKAKKGEEGASAKLQKAVNALKKLEAQSNEEKEVARKAQSYREILAAYDKTLPYDQYYRLSKYADSNFEALMQATQALYPVRSDMENVVIVYDTSNSLEEAKRKRMALASEMVSINTIPMGVPVYVGPMKENLANTEFMGRGAELFRQMMEFQKREAREGGAILDKIASVRKRREGVMPADPSDVKEFSDFVGGLRNLSSQGTRNLTTAERDLIDAAEGDDETAKRDAVTRVRDEREAAEDAEIVASIPEGHLATQLINTNPDTGKLEKTTVFLESDELAAENMEKRLATVGEIRTMEGEVIDRIGGEE